MNQEPEESLEAAGLTGGEESAYRSLLLEPGMAAGDLSATLEIDEAEAGRALEALERKGLATRSPGLPQRFMPVSPALALEALVIRREQELERIRLQAQHLEDSFRVRRLPIRSAQLVEVLDSAEIVGQRALHLLRAAKDEFLTFDKPPYTTTAAESDPEVDRALRRGVRVRAIYDRESLAGSSGLGLSTVHRFLRQGEEGRVFPQLPFKMNIADRTAAILPLVFEESGMITGALVVHSPHLVEALALLWEILWEQALPIPDREELPTSGAGSPWNPTGQEAHLVDLLLAGAKSEAIAHQLGLGLSTVERRIRRLMKALGADTRFQAGFQLARRMASSDRTAVASGEAGGPANASVTRRD